MFAPTLDSLRLNPDEDVPARPFIEVQSMRDANMRQVYYGLADRNFPVGAIVTLPDEKVEGLQWRVTRRWLYIPSVQITVAADDTNVVYYGLQHTFLKGNGPYMRVSQKQARKLWRRATETETETETAS